MAHSALWRAVAANGIDSWKYAIWKTRVESTHTLPSGLQSTEEWLEGVFASLRRSRADLRCHNIARERQTGQRSCADIRIALGSLSEFLSASFRRAGDAEGGGVAGVGQMRNKLEAGLALYQGQRRGDHLLDDPPRRLTLPPTLTLSPQY